MKISKNTLVVISSLVIFLSSIFYKLNTSDLLYPFRFNLLILIDYIAKVALIILLLFPSKLNYKIAALPLSIIGAKILYDIVDYSRFIFHGRYEFLFMAVSSYLTIFILLITFFFICYFLYHLLSKKCSNPKQIKLVFLLTMILSILKLINFSFRFISTLYFLSGNSYFGLKYIIYDPFLFVYECGYLICLGLSLLYYSSSNNRNLTFENFDNK